MQTNISKLNNTVIVYIASFDSGVAVGAVEPSIRNEMIQRCTDTLTQQQRYCVWKLLDYALLECYGKGVKDFNFYIDDNGKWNCRNGVHFSLTHCNNVVAVALCNHFVGVDVESVANFERHVASTEFAERILTDNEKELLQNTSAVHKTEMLAQLWTKKESFFKLSSRKEFAPKSIDTTKLAIHSQSLTINGEQYALAVARYIPSKIELRFKQIQW